MDLTSGSSTGVVTPPPPGEAAACSLSHVLTYVDPYYTTEARLVQGAAAIYLLTETEGEENKVRRFTLTDALPCNLELDETFGDAGLLSVGERPYSLALAGNDRVFVGEDFSSGKGTRRVWPPPTVGCNNDDIGALTIDPPGARMASATQTDVFLHDISGAACKPDMTLAISGDQGREVESLVIDPSGALHVGAAGPDDTVVLRFAADGSLLGQYGNAGDAFAEDGFCSIAGMSVCGADICIWDKNCAALKRFTADGTFVVEYDMFPIREAHDVIETSITGDSDGSRIYLGAVTDTERKVLRMSL